MVEGKKVQTAKAYTKQQIIQSKQYTPKDALKALLDERQKYTCHQIKAILDDFLTKEVG